MTPFRIVIPARYASSRLPGKPLRDIAGKTMIERVWANAVSAGAVSVHVATDDDRIAAVVRGFGGEVAMTDPSHASGSDRLAEVAQQQGFDDDDILVNLQGDEPFVGPQLLRQVAQALADRPEAGISTLATPIIHVGDLFDPNVVKVTLADSGLAQYFSRAPIPWVRDSFAQGMPNAMPKAVPFYRHLGLYAYRSGTLRAVSAAPQSGLENAEALEQLRALAMGIGIHVTVIPEPPGHGVDTEDDLLRAEEALR